MSTARKRLTPNQLTQALARTLIEEEVSSKTLKNRLKRARRRKRAALPAVPTRVGASIAPLAQGSTIRIRAPNLGSLPGGDVVLSHVELSTELSVTATIVVSTEQVMPYTVGTWLRGVAANWSKYAWLEVRYTYLPSCPATTSGSIHMGFMYDQADTPPTSVNQLSNLKGYVSGPVWDGQCGLCFINGGPKANSSGAISTALDVGKVSLKSYPYKTSTDFATATGVNANIGNSLSPARLVIAMLDGDTATGIACGRLYVTYRIRLMEPIAAAMNQ